MLGHNNIQLYGIRSCQVLKEYLCGESEYLLSVAMVEGGVEGGRVFGFGQAGTIRAFNFRTQEQVGTIAVARGSGTELVKVVQTASREGEHIFHICTNKFVLTLTTKL
jgi:hypothetical protein